MQLLLLEEESNQIMQGKLLEAIMLQIHLHIKLIRTTKGIAAAKLSKASEGGLRKNINMVI